MELICIRLAHTLLGSLHAPIRVWLEAHADGAYPSKALTRAHLIRGTTRSNAIACSAHCVARKHMNQNATPGKAWPKMAWPKLMTMYPERCALLHPWEFGRIPVVFMVIIFRLCQDCVCVCVCVFFSLDCWASAEIIALAGAAGPCSEELWFLLVTTLWSHQWSMIYLSGSCGLLTAIRLCCPSIFPEQNMLNALGAPLRLKHRRLALVILWPSRPE